MGNGLSDLIFGRSAVEEARKAQLKVEKARKAFQEARAEADSLARKAVEEARKAVEEARKAAEKNRKAAEKARRLTAARERAEAQEKEAQLKKAQRLLAEAQEKEAQLKEAQQLLDQETAARERSDAQLAAKKKSLEQAEEEQRRLRLKAEQEQLNKQKADEALSWMMSKEGVKQELEAERTKIISTNWKGDAMAAGVAFVSLVCLGYEDLKDPESIIKDIVSVFANVKCSGVAEAIRQMAAAAINTVARDGSKIIELTRGDYSLMEFVDGELAYRIQYALSFKYLKPSKEQSDAKTKVGICYRVVCDKIPVTPELMTFPQLIKMGLASASAAEIERFCGALGEGNDPALQFKSKSPDEWSQEDVTAWLKFENRGQYVKMFEENGMDGAVLFDPEMFDDVQQVFAEAGIKKMQTKVLVKKILTVREKSNIGGRNWFYVGKSGRVEIPVRGVTSAIGGVQINVPKGISG